MDFAEIPRTEDHVKLLHEWAIQQNPAVGNCWLNNLGSIMENSKKRKGWVETYRQKKIKALIF